MLLALRKGEISKWFSGIGQEAIAVGSTLALAPDDFILPRHRNLGVFTSRNLSLKKLFSQVLGKTTGFTKGRDRSFHFGSREHRIVGMISHLGAQTGVADGIALGEKLKKTKSIALVFLGDGDSSEGDVHEALNIASVWDLPVIFFIENNHYGLSTPVAEQYNCERLVDRAMAYGIQGIEIDGNNILEVYSNIHHTANSIRTNPSPTLIVGITFRRRGHEEASGTKYVPKELMSEWEQKDPLVKFEQFLLEKDLLKEEQKNSSYQTLKNEIDQAFQEALNEPDPTPDPERESASVYAPSNNDEKPAQGSAISKKRYLDAISDGLRTACREFSDLVIMGQDIAEYGGVFKITEGFLEEFGPERIRNTPLCESAVLAAAFGLSISGMKSVVEMQFADFVTCGFNQIVNNIAKGYYRWGQKADLVIRMPTGGGVRAGPFHSQSTEAWFFRCPGLKIVYPAFPHDAKGLLLAAIEDPNPVLYFEHKALYRKIEGPVADDFYTLPIGQANIIQKGKDISIITYGLGVHWAQEILANHSEIDATLVDLRSLQPLDRETIRTAASSTGKVMVLHEDRLSGGIGGDIAADIVEHCFSDLKAPVMRCASLDTPIPFAANLEDSFLAKSRLEEKLLALLRY